MLARKREFTRPADHISTTMDFCNGLGGTPMALHSHGTVVAIPTGNKWGANRCATGDPMRCSKCGSDNLAGKRFCGNCRTPLANRCPKCGADNPPAKRFCSDCGTSLSASSVAPQSPASSGSAPESPISAEWIGTSTTVNGERKTVTALFADMKGSMDLMEDLDPEEARAIVDPALKLMIDAVHRYGGYVVQSTGDGIFALFGASVAARGPSQALHAALRRQEEVKRYSDRMRLEGKLPPQAPVGVNTGEVVVRSIQTGEAHAEYTPIGHTANLAARMQVLAPIGSIAATEQVRKLSDR